MPEAKLKPKWRKRSLFPKTLESCLEPVTKPVLSKNGLASSRILTDWQQIAGSKLAAYCMPIKISFPKGKQTGGTLTIAVQNGFATELQHMQPLILEKLAVFFGYRAVDHIKISHTFPSLKPTPQKEPPPPQASITPPAILDDVEDPELKAALQSFAQTLSAKKNSL